jgi:TrmH family RNA methyltransferase
LAKDRTVMPASSPSLSLRAIRRLHSRKERRQTGRFLAEGIRPVMASLQANAAIEMVLYAPALLRSEHGEMALDLARSQGVPCGAVDAATFASISTQENPHGIACVGRQAWTELDGISCSVRPVVALYAPQDPGNLGTILRTCDATACSGVVLIGDCVDPWHPAAVRAAMGATFSIRLAATGIDTFASWVDHHRLDVVGTSDRAAVDYATVAFPQRFVLLMGSERQGLPAALERLATTMVRIPMAGAVDSLNLAIATALVLYEARNQQRRSGSLASR